MPVVIIEGLSAAVGMISALLSALATARAIIWAWRRLRQAFAAR